MAEGQQAPWFHGRMTAEKATIVCNRIGQNGAFLVRESQSANGRYTLSLFFDDEVYHHRIKMKGKKFQFEATNQEFASLNDIVTHFSKPGEDLIHPLTVAIYPSLVKQMDDELSEQIPSVTSPLYVSVNSMKPYLDSTPIPQPKDYVYEKGHFTGNKISEDNSTQQEEDWPAPPPCALQPAVKPKPSITQKSGRQTSNYFPSRPASCYNPRKETENITLGGYSQQIGPSAERKESSGTRRRHRSFTESSNAHTEIRSNITRAATIAQRKPARKENRHDTKRSPFKAFTHLFRKKKWQPPQNVNSKDEESARFQPISDNVEDNPEFSPIICKTRFVAIQDNFGVDGAMEFKKGTEMVIKGVRVDGWWYCLNKLTTKYGWVYQDHIKPISDQTWFEAKPVETDHDKRVYEEYDGDSFDEDDDENYCRYILPVEGSETVDKSKQTGGVYICE